MTNININTIEDTTIAILNIWGEYDWDTGISTPGSVEEVRNYVDTQHNGSTSGAAYILWDNELSSYSQSMIEESLNIMLK